MPLGIEGQLDFAATIMVDFSAWPLHKVGSHQVGIGVLAPCRNDISRVDVFTVSSVFGGGGGGGWCHRSRVRA